MQLEKKVLYFAKGSCTYQWNKNFVNVTRKNSIVTIFHNFSKEILIFLKKKLFRKNSLLEKNVRIYCAD